MPEIIGTPISQSASGERIFHVRDEGYMAGDARARGPNTRNRLSFHTDRCDVIAFMCLRQAKSGGENDLVSSAALYNQVRRRRPDLLAELMRPYYYQRHNVDRGNQLPFRQQPGDILLLNNWVTFHRRSEFEDYDDAERKRHILRIWLSVPNSRPLDPLFKDNYGATEAGAIRGGMPAKVDP